jgi:heat-inducible transcriptional repressor
MTERQRRILHLLIDHYIQGQAPVASGVLAQQLALSPALMRYELIALEEAGFIAKPHTSAGRIPTRAGFRHYALSRLPPEGLPYTTISRLTQVLDEAGVRREALVVQVAAKLSGYPAMLRLRPQRAPKIVQVHLSPLSPGKVLAVAVLEGGRVKEARLELSFSPSEAQLQEAETKLRGPLDSPPSSPALREIYEAARRAFAQGSPEEYREGMSLLLGEPEAQSPNFLRLALSIFEGRGEEVFTPPGGLNLRVGESEGLSLVQAGVKVGDQIGELSLLGPLRMRYAQALSVAYGLGQAYMGGGGKREGGG